MQLPARRIALASLLVVHAAVAQLQEKTDLYDDGHVKARYVVDADGVRAGACEEYHPDGTLAVRAHYRAGALEGGYESFHPGGARFVTANYDHGKLTGSYEEQSADAARVWTSTWAAGKLQGDAKVTINKKVAITQKWKDGVLVQLNGFVPHPRPEAAVRDQIQKILALPAPAGAAAKDPRADARYAGLRRLQAYRWLCGIAWEDLSLDPAFDDLCDAAAEVCEKLGRLDHHPPDPGGLPPGRYEQGKQGAGNSNLFVGADLPGSVDGYVDDSDPSNVQALGHRRWCLNPPLKKTGFGMSGRFSAMWAMDHGGSIPKGLKSVSYPPAGFLPGDFIGPNYAWSVSFLAGPWSAKVNPKATVESLDEHYVPTGAPLYTRAWVATGGYGVSNCAAFLPRDLDPAPGHRYLATLSLDGGATTALQWLVEIVAPVVKKAN